MNIQGTDDKWHKYIDVGVLNIQYTENKQSNVTLTRKWIEWATKIVYIT